MRLLRILVILSHRYLGILISLLFVIWFLSAFTIMYTGGMPRIKPAERYQRMPDLDMKSVRLSLAEVIPAGYTVQAAKLESLLNRPVYRLIDRHGRRLLVYADDGDLQNEVDIDASAAVAAAFLGTDKASLVYAGTVTVPDQWTLTVARDLPMHKFDVMDDARTEIYVDPVAAEVGVYTTGRSRLLAWLGAIPHWFYITALRSNQPLWYKTVVWSALAGCGLTLLGLIIAVMQYRRSKPFSIGRGILYRGWIRIHYLLGFIFGVFILTWIFSGLLSMEPYAWTTARGLEVPQVVFSGGAFKPELHGIPGFRQLNAVLGNRRLKYIEFLQIQGHPYYVAGIDNADVNAQAVVAGASLANSPDNRSETEYILIDSATMSIAGSFDIEGITEVLDAAVDADITDTALLDQYDNYYYSRQDDRPLPVLRVKFNDPQQTWIYIDPGLSRIVFTANRWERLERWLYKGLHSLDFSFWYFRRPLWDAGVIFLLAGGLLTSLIGFYLGMKRLSNNIRTLLFEETG